MAHAVPARPRDKRTRGTAPVKKFLILNYGFEVPTAEVVNAWTSWFASVERHLVDSGNPFSAGREITRNGTRELPRTPTSITGYCILEAESLDAAERLLAGFPLIESVRIYETVNV
jgi:hypothetical protein